MADTLTRIRLAQAVGITTSAMLSGAIFFSSYGLVPSLLLAPTSLLVRQWRTMFLRGKSAAPPVAAISSVAYGYLAIKLHNAPLSTEHPRGELYALAAALTLCIIPYTLLVMKNVNAKLMAKAEGMKNLDVKDEVTEVGLPKGESAKELLDWWGVVNLGRGVFPLLGAVVGIWTSLR